MDENCHAVKSAADSDANAIVVVDPRNSLRLLGSEEDEETKRTGFLGSIDEAAHLERPRDVLLAVQKLSVHDSRLVTGIELRAKDCTFRIFNVANDMGPRHDDLLDAGSLCSMSSAAARAVERLKMWKRESMTLHR